MEEILHEIQNGANELSGSEFSTENSSLTTTRLYGRPENRFTLSRRKGTEPKLHVEEDENDKASFILVQLMLLGLLHSTKQDLINIAYT